MEKITVVLGGVAGSQIGSRENPGISLNRLEEVIAEIKILSGIGIKYDSRIIDLLEDKKAIERRIDAAIPNFSGLVGYRVQDFARKGDKLILLGESYYSSSDLRQKQPYPYHQWADPMPAV